jgi:hypothetical protein
MAHNVNEDILKFIGICVIAGVLVFYGAKLFKLQAKVLEGAANMSDEPAAEGSSTNGEAAKAAEFNKLLKARIAGLQDKLLISKYRTEYENILLSLDDFMKLNMLQTALQIKPNQDSEPGKPNPNMALFASMKAMSDARGTLNGIMTYLDSQ